MADASPRGGDLFVCSHETCGKSFHKKSRLLIHLRSHTGERPFVCSHESCVKSYSRAAHLKRHVDFTHRDQATDTNQQVRCQVKDCDSKFSNQWNLARHVKRKHESPSRYVCPEEGCGKVCKSHKHLRRHHREHLLENSYRCPKENCGKVFSCEANLKRHQKMHDGYLCQVPGCQEKFETWSLVRKHVALQHSALNCPECGKKFLNKFNLKKHLPVHMEERPVFECSRDNCGRMYLSKKNLQAHVRSYHDGKRIPCEHQGCDRTFSYRNKMLQHLSLHDANRPLPKKKVKKHRKPRKKPRKKPRGGKDMAASLCGLEGRLEVGSPDPGLHLLPDDEDKVDLSGYDSDIKETSSQAASSYTTTQVEESSLGDQSISADSALHSRVISSEAEILSELSHTFVKGPKLKRFSSERVVSLFCSESETECDLVLSSKGSILKVSPKTDSLDEKQLFDFVSDLPCCEKTAIAWQLTLNHMAERDAETADLDKCKNCILAEKNKFGAKNCDLENLSTVVTDIPVTDIPVTFGGETVEHVDDIESDVNTNVASATETSENVDVDLEAHEGHGMAIDV